MTCTDTHNHDCDLLSAQSYARGKVAQILRFHPDEVEDVLQAAAVNAIKKSHTFRGDGAFNTWFTKIAMNLALMHIRPSGRNRGKVELDAPLADGRVMEVVDAGPGPWEMAVAGELLDRVRSVKLPWSLREELGRLLAEEPNGSDAAGKSRRFRLRERLREGVLRA